MKCYFKIMSVIMVALMMFSAITVANAKSSELTEKQIQDITEMSEFAQRYADLTSQVGNPIHPYDYSYLHNIETQSNEIENKSNSLLYFDGDISLLGDINNSYSTLKLLLSHPIIDAEYASYTYFLSLNENNYNDFYNSDDWDMFVEYRENLHTALADVTSDIANISIESPTQIQKEKITDAFFKLNELYNEMSLNNALMGDVNCDGSVDIDDATLVQNYLAGNIELTQAQLLRATTTDNAYKNGPVVDISSATNIQKYLSGVDLGLEYDLFQRYNIPSREIWATHSSYTDFAGDFGGRYAKPWNPILTIYSPYDCRLDEMNAD